MTVLLLILILAEAQGSSLKNCVWAFDFRLRLIFIKSLFFCSTKSGDSFTLKRHNYFQSKNKRKATHSFARRRPIFKMQQEVWKFNDNSVSWSSPKTTLQTNFLNLEN